MDDNGYLYLEDAKVRQEEEENPFLESDIKREMSVVDSQAAISSCLIMHKRVYAEEHIFRSTQSALCHPFS